MNERRSQAHDSRVVWIQANYVNADPALYAKHRQRERDLGGLQCQTCSSKKVPDDSDSEDLTETTLGDQSELLR